MVYDTYNCSIHGLKPHQLYRLNIYGKPMEEPQEKSRNGCSWMFNILIKCFLAILDRIFIDFPRESHRISPSMAQVSPRIQGGVRSGLIRLSQRQVLRIRDDQVHLVLLSWDGLREGIQFYT